MFLHNLIIHFDIEIMIVLPSVYTDDHFAEPVSYVSVYTDKDFDVHVSYISVYIDNI